MFDSFAGLPLHPLVLHAYVVLGPLVAIAALIFSAMPKTRTVLRWPLLVGGAVTAVAAFITKETGEALEKRIGESALVEAHAQWGDIAGAAGVLFGALTIGTVLLTWKFPQAPRLLKVASVVALAIAAVAVVGTVILAGHSGATSVWSDALN